MEFSLGKLISVKLDHDYPKSNDPYDIACTFFYKENPSERDYKESYKWFKKAYDENKDYAALYHMGRMHLFDLGMIGNTEHGLKALEIAMDGGSKHAYTFLLNLYFGYYDFFEPDYDYLRLLSYRALEKKYRSAIIGLGLASYKIAKKYHDSKHFRLAEETFDEAKVQLKKAYAKGYTAASYYLGLMHLNGFSFPKNAYHALEYLKKSADGNYSPAKTLLRSTLKNSAKSGDFATQSQVSRFIEKHQNALDSYLPNSGKISIRES